MIFVKNGSHFKFEIDNSLLNVHVYKDDDYHDCVDIPCKMSIYHFESFCKEYLSKWV